MTADKQHKIMLMAGGTGGHIYPALAVGKYLEQQGWELHWLGSEGGMETRIVPREAIAVSTIKVSGVRGKSLLTRLLAPLKLLQAIWQAMQVIRRERPDVVLGMGGFASGPGGLAAWLLRVPMVIHEQNAVAGMTNRWLAKLANSTLTAFPETLPQAVAVTGNPVRAEISNLAEPQVRFAERQGSLQLMVVGGSRGAAILNQIVPEAIALLKDKLPLKLYHQTGAGHLGVVKSRYSELELLAHENLEIELKEFIEDMQAAYEQADLVICRSGALTVSELANAGVGSVLVPFPHAVDDHQTKNATYLADAGAAYLLPQSELTSERLAELIEAIGTRERCLELASKAREMAKPNATRTVAEFCQRATESNRKAA